MILLDESLSATDIIRGGRLYDHTKSFHVFQSSVSLHLEHGLLDIRPLVEQASLIACPNLRTLLQNVQSAHPKQALIPFFSFLGIAAKHVGNNWLVCQLIIRLSIILESHMAGRMPLCSSIKHAQRARYDRIEAQQKERRVIVLDAAGNKSKESKPTTPSALALAYVLMSYLMSVRRSMEGAFVLHVATDAARGGKKELLWTAVLDTTNQFKPSAAWAPCQVANTVSYVYNTYKYR